MTPEPQKAEEKRREIIEAVAAHLVTQGFRNSGIRALAKSVGISDRMVMYYFDTKEELIAEAINMIGDRLTQGMEGSLPNGSATVDQMLNALLAENQTPEVKVVLRLWFEIVGLAMRGDEPYRQTAAALVARSEERIREKLRANQKHRAREVFARLEGELMLGLLQE